MRRYLSAVLGFVIHLTMMFLGAVIILKQTRIPRTLKLINLVATMIYATWLIAKALCER